MKRLLVVADVLNEKRAWLSWDGRARAHDEIDRLGEHEMVVMPWEDRYVLPINNKDTQNIDLVIVHLSTVWVQGSELAGVSFEIATEWVKSLFTQIVTSNRNARVLTVVDSEEHVKYQQLEPLRELLLRQFDMYS